MDILDRCSREIHRFYNTMNFPTPSVPNIPAFPAAAERAIASINMKWRPLTKNNILFHYLPLQGLISYSALSINVMHPNILFRIFSKRDVTNVLLLSAGGGAALWIWARPHMQAAAPARRFSWAFLCGSMWSLGSILLWAIIKTSIGNRPVLAMLLGLSSGAVLTYTGKDYFEYVDQIITGEIMHDDLNDVSPQSDEDRYDLEM